MQIKEKIENDIAILSFKGDLLGEPDTTKIREKIKEMQAS